MSAEITGINSAEEAEKGVGWTGTMVAGIVNPKAFDRTISVEPTTNPKDLLGVKKPQLHLIPPVANILEAKVMELGAAKYGAYNWRKHPVRATVYISAIQRHLAAWLDGQDDDTESGISHIAHVRACCGILLDAHAGGSNLVDDRPAPGASAFLIKALTKERPMTEEIIEVPTETSEVQPITSLPVEEAEFVYDEIAHARQLVADVIIERVYQIEKWGGYETDDRENGPFQWVGYITQYAMKWFGGGFDTSNLAALTAFRRSMVKVAALGVSAAQWADRSLDALQHEQLEAAADAQEASNGTAE